MKKINAVLFGAGGVGRRLFDLLVDGDDYNVIAFVDNDKSKHGSDYRGVPIYSPSYLNKLAFERLIYATQMGFGEIGVQIEALGVPLDKVEKGYIETISNARLLSLQRAAEQIHHGGWLGLWRKLEFIEERLQNISMLLFQRENCTYSIYFQVLTQKISLMNRMPH